MNSKIIQLGLTPRLKAVVEDVMRSGKREHVQGALILCLHSFTSVQLEKTIKELAELAAKMDATHAKELLEAGTRLRESSENTFIHALDMIPALKNFEAVIVLADRLRDAFITEARAASDNAGADDESVGGEETQEMMDDILRKMKGGAL